MCKQFKYLNHYPSMDSFKGFIHVDDTLKLPCSSKIRFSFSSFIVGHFVGSSFRIDKLFDNSVLALNYLSNYSDSVGFIVNSSIKKL